MTITKQTGSVIAIVAVIAVLAGALWYYMTRPSEAVKSEVTETERQVTVMEETAREFARVMETISTETKRKVVVVREDVVSEMRALDPDGLASAALGEIELFRGHAGGGADPGAAGLAGTD